MKQSDIDLRRDWIHLSTPDLEAMLRSELEKNTPDDDVVIQILHILEAREPDELPKLTKQEQKAYEEYKQKIISRRKRPLMFPRWLSVAACAVLVLGMMTAVIPQQAEAETFWEMLQRISNSVVEFFSREDRFDDEEYVFATDNPGLQQVYNAVVEMGVTDPVVPMWLPDGCALISCEEKNTPMTKCVFASFSYDNNEIVYELDVYEGQPAHQYYIDDSYYESYEQEGATFYISRNNDRWSVVWTKENIECLLTLDCQEDTLRRILKSIYVLEE